MANTFEPFYVERSPSSRANCRVCHEPCMAKELRIAKVTNSPYGNDKPLKMWHHLDCLMNSFMKQRTTTKRITSISEMENFDNLTDEDKTTVINKLNDMEKQYASKHNIAVVQIDLTDTTQNDTSSDIPVQSERYENHKDNSFQRFQSLCKEIAAHDKYTDKTEIVKLFFNKGSDKTEFKGDVSLWVKLLLPGVVKRIYNLKDRQLIKLFSKMLNANHDDMLEDLENGNVGETIAKFFKESKIISSQSTLNIFEIDKFLSKLAALTKEDEQMFHFKSIITKCTDEDIKYLIYLIKGDLRMNAGCKHVLNALHSDAFEKYRSTSNMDVVLSLIVNKDVNGKQKISPKKLLDAGSIEVMKPIAPMLAQACKSIEMAMKKCPNGMMSEIKYDGERVQLHMSKNEFKFFTRSLINVLDYKIENVKRFVFEAFPNGKDLILDCEILMINSVTGELLPFGTLSKNKKTENADAVECLFVFDCLYFNGESLIERPIRERREILQNNMVEVRNRILFSKFQEIHKPSDLKNMIAEVLNKGLEGLVLKDLNSKYEPGKRHWLKIKKDYLLDGAMADSADLVVLGAWFGTGKKGGMLSIFLMGCHDRAENRWLTVTKVSTGFDDDTLASLQDPLKENMNKISKDVNKIPSWLKHSKTLIPDFVAKDPKKQPVWEIAGAEFSRAKNHTAGGISIRFPRVIRMRPDKTWETATNFNELKVLYENSKKNIDYSNLLVAPDDKNYDSSKKSNLTSVKRKIDVEDEPTKISKKSEQTDKSSNNTAIAKPLPDIFTNCCLFFCPSKTVSYDSENVKMLERHWIAFGGEMDNEDGSKATHVIHLDSEISTKEYETLPFQFSRTARHVTIDWLEHSIYHKVCTDTRPYAVTLI